MFSFLTILLGWLLTRCQTEQAEGGKALQTTQGHVGLVTVSVSRSMGRGLAPETATAFSQKTSESHFASGPQLSIYEEDLSCSITLASEHTATALCEPMRHGFAGTGGFRPGCVLLVS